MLGLAFILLSAVTILLYCGWIFLIAKIYRYVGSGKLLTPLKLLAGMLFALAPLHRVLVYPLVKEECSQHGRIVFHSVLREAPRDLLIDGSFYNLHARHPISDMFSSGAIDSVTFEGNSFYGEGRDIKNAAEQFDANPFTLHVSNSSDISCGPFFNFAARSSLMGFSATDETSCLAISQKEVPERYIKVSAMSRKGASWRTAFHILEWKDIKYDLVENTEKKPILELKEFEYDGLQLPILLRVFSVGSYACKADKDPQEALLGILHAHANSSENPKRFAEFSKEKEQALTDEYWGFVVPKKISSYLVGFWDHDGLASKKTPLSVTLHIPKHPLPVKLKLMSNVAVEWEIEAADGQLVLAESFVPKEGTKIDGLAANQIWEYGDKEVERNPLLKFYIRRIREAESQAILDERYCEISHRASSAVTNLQINSCNKAPENQ